MAEHRFRKAGVVGSNPTFGFFHHANSAAGGRARAARNIALRVADREDQREDAQDDADHP